MPPPSAARKTQTESGSNRRQSGRQIRTSTSRPLNYYARPFGSLGGAADEPQQEDPPGFFPAVQFFTDAITALPKETMRHFTLMKEVEAKIHGPSQTVTQLAQRILDMPAPPRRSRQPSQHALLSFTANNSSAATSVHGSVVNGHVPVPPPQSSEAYEQSSQPAPIDPQADVARRQEFHNLRMVIQSILINLDEKNVCLAEANRTLGKQLGRMEGVIPHVEAEISEEARLGSLTHWAYADNRVKNKPAAATTERARRDVAATNSLAAAAATVHEGDIAAVRGEARREAKKARNQPVDSEFEDRPAAKKSQAGKGRKGPVESLPGPKGLGITNGALGALQPQKRRKVDKEAGVAMERSMSGTQKTLAKAAGNTPRSTPASEPVKKKSKAPPAPPAIKKSRNPTVNSPQQSPRLAGSPSVGTFPFVHEAQRPSSIRNRQNSSTLQHSISADQPLGRPASAGDDKIGTGERSHRGSANKVKEAPNEPGDKMEVDGTAATQQVSTGADVKQDPAVGHDETDAEGLRASSRASIMSTPNPEHEGIPMARTRSNGVRSTEPHPPRSSARNGEARSHSRSGSQHILKQIASFNRSPVLSRRELTADEDVDSTQSEDQDSGRPKRKTTSRRGRPQTPDEDVVGGEVEGVYGAEVVEEEEENEHDPDDPNEPKYCYCGRGSYGQMIACDNDNCEREWFHLECTGLKTAPAENVKWFCNDCDPKLRKKSRPISRH